MMRLGCKILAARSSIALIRGQSSQSSIRCLSTSHFEYEYIQHKIPAPRVALITLNRPKALNALSSGLMKEVNDCLGVCDRDDSIGAVVITGSEKAFAAGADIKEMKDLTFAKVVKEDFIASWGDMSRIKKPILAAVNGFALGGGCELAMMADIIYAGDGAKFGQPEIKLGVIPGAGGSQRLTRAMGKARAMHYILTGDQFSAQEALESGLVAKVYPRDQLVAKTIEHAASIASFGALAVQYAKEAVNSADELNLSEGRRFERKLFHSLFSTHDQKEGMAAFSEKRKPEWHHE